MVCPQVKIYVTYFVIQILISVALVGSVGIHIVGPLVFTGTLYLLCEYKHYTVANVLVTIAILLGVIVDLYSLTHRNAIKRALHMQVSRKKNVHKQHLLGPGGIQQ